MGNGSMSYQLKTARLMMIFFNVIIFLIGASLLGQGLDLLITRRFQNLLEFPPMFDTQTRLLTNEILYITMVIPGLILLLIGFFGCSGAITQMPCILFWYLCLLSIVLIFQTILIICLIIFRSKLKEQLTIIIQLFIRNKYEGSLKKNPQSISVLWDVIMHHFKCCGIENKSNFHLTTKWNRTNPWWNNSLSIENKYFQYPLTCCPINDLVFDKLISCATNGSDIYETSCYQKFAERFHSIEYFLTIFIPLIIFIEMFVLIFVLIIYNRNQMKTPLYCMETLPPAYSSRTRINNGNLYVQI